MINPTQHRNQKLYSENIGHFFICDFLSQNISGLTTQRVSSTWWTAMLESAQAALPILWIVNDGEICRLLAPRSPRKPWEKAATSTHYSPWLSCSHTHGPKARKGAALAPPPQHRPVWPICRVSPTEERSSASGLYQGHSDTGFDPGGAQL